MQIWKTKIHFILQEIFHYSLGTYLVLILLEIIKKGLVSTYVNLDFIFLIILVSGTQTLIFSPKIVIKEPSKPKPYEEIQNSLTLAVVGGFVVYFVSKNDNNLAIFSALLTFSLILVISIILLQEKSDQ